MRTAKKRRGKAVEAPTESKAGRGCAGAKKSTEITNGQLPKATGQGDGLLVERDENSSPSNSAEAFCPEHQRKCTNFSETTKKIPVLELYSGKVLHPSAKMKLQLFPVDEGTCVGLEKDGFHPYLELTLSSRKKLCSVLKHLNSKWGSSSIAQGEPMLFPYNRVEHLASYRWTMKNNDISAGDVYAAIGSPVIFRLRYGWFSDTETKACGKPSASTPPEPCFHFGSKQKSSSTKLENAYCKGKPIEVRSEEFSKPIFVSEATNAVVAKKMSSNGAVQPMDNEVMRDDAFDQSSMLWADSLSNISIGGLLSEASLQGKFNNCDRRSNGNNTGSQLSLLISESFDAFLTGQINHFQGPSPPPLNSRSSILDGEDTCHAFPFQKFSSSEKDAMPLGRSGGSTTSLTFSQDAGSKSFKFPNVTEASGQSGNTQGHAYQESETDLLLCSRVYNDESSLGLSGIKWTESLGPFDLGLSSSRKIVSGDNISFSNIVN